MGPSGSGKSTLLYIIGGLLTPTKGEVLINGVSIYKLNSRERAKLRQEKIGFIFQTFELIPYLTSLENVMVPLCFSKIPNSKHEEKAIKALNLVGLTNRASHKPSELSGGEQQRVSIARAIVNDPSILLADEPTGNLDQKTGAEIMHLIKKLNEEKGITVILATHDSSKARFADKVAILID
jgi:putative ABC transport system ATP-binding protein